MRDDAKRHLVVVDRDVRMVARRFGEIGDAVDEGDRPQERSESELLA